MGKMGINSLCSANAIFSWSPSKNVIAVVVNNRSRLNSVDSLLIEGGGEKLMIPNLCVGDLEIRDISTQRGIGNC